MWERLRALPSGCHEIAIGEADVWSAPYQFCITEAAPPIEVKTRTYHCSVRRDFTARSGRPSYTLGFSVEAASEAEARRIAEETVRRDPDVDKVLVFGCDLQ